MRVNLPFSSDKSMITCKNEKNKRVNLFSSLDDGMQIQSIPVSRRYQTGKTKGRHLTRVEIQKHIDRSVLWRVIDNKRECPNNLLRVFNLVRKDIVENIKGRCA